MAKKNGQADEQPEESKNTTNLAFQDVYNEITDLRSKLADANARLERLSRTARLDEKEFAVGQLQSERALINTMSQLARAVDSLTLQKIDEETRVEYEGEALWLAGKERRYRDGQKRLAHTRYLLTLPEERTAECSCGKHQGIRFVKTDGQVLEDNLCPVHWWISQSRVAFEDGILGQFTAELPLVEYLERYALEDNKTEPAQAAEQPKTPAKSKKTRQTGRQKR